MPAPASYGFVATVGAFVDSFDETPVDGAKTEIVRKICDNDIFF